MPPDASTTTPPPRPNFRKLTSLDRNAFRDHLLRLTPDDRRLRFCGRMRDDAVAAYADGVDWLNAVVVGAFVDGRLRGIGELSRRADTAEIALSVEAAWQNEGLGTELLRRILTVARNRYVARVHMVCLAENVKMQSIARKFEADLVRRPGEVEGRLWPPWPSMGSLMAEAAADGEALFGAIFDPLHPAADAPLTRA